MKINTLLINSVVPILARINHNNNETVSLTKFCDAVKGSGCATCKYHEFCTIAYSPELGAYLHEQHPELFI